MFVVPRRSLNLTILSCEALPPVTADRLWAHEAVRNEHSSLKRKLDQAREQLIGAAAGAENALLRLNIDPNAPATPQVAMYMQYLEAVGKLQDFQAMYGDSATSDRKMAPNCYACVTLERNNITPPMAVTEVKRANYDPFWNCTTDDINIDVMLMCGAAATDMESGSYLYCQRLRIAVYHDFGFGQEGGCTAWKAGRAGADGLFIGDAFLAVGELFADPCQKRHELKVHGADHSVLSGCTLHIETKVSCTTATVPKVLLPQLGAECGRDCAADVSLSSACHSICVPSAVELAVAPSKGSSKHKCSRSRSKPKCKCAKSRC